MNEQAKERSLDGNSTSEIAVTPGILHGHKLGLGQTPQMKHVNNDHVSSSYNIMLENNVKSNSKLINKDDEAPISPKIISSQPIKKKVSGKQIKTERYDLKNDVSSPKSVDN